MNHTEPPTSCLQTLPSSSSWVCSSSRCCCGCGRWASASTWSHPSTDSTHSSSHSPPSSRSAGTNKMEDLIDSIPNNPNILPGVDALQAQGRLLRPLRPQGAQAPQDLQGHRVSTQLTSPLISIGIQGKKVSHRLKEFCSCSCLPLLPQLA